MTASMTGEWFSSSGRVVAFVPSGVVKGAVR